MVTEDVVVACMQMKRSERVATGRREEIDLEAKPVLQRTPEDPSTRNRHVFSLTLLVVVWISVL